MPTDTLAVPGLDEATKQELQPPCERHKHPPCSEVAEYAVKLKCHCGYVSGIMLLCKPHVDYTTSGGAWVHGEHQAQPLVVFSEKL